MATTYRTHGLVLTEHDFEVPVDHDRPDSSRITVFAREVADPDGLVHYRADAVVRDAELVRQELDVDRWSVLGQSFGGFCVTRYLSSAPEGLREAFITGGLPAFETPVDDVYAHTFELAIERSRRYYERYPEDRERVRALLAEPVPLASGDLLTSDRVHQLGLNLGMSGGAETL